MLIIFMQNVTRDILTIEKNINYSTIINYNVFLRNNEGKIYI